MKHLIDRPMSEWESTIDALPMDERMELIEQFSARATHLARLAAYLSRRLTGGKHADAVKAQNRAARKVRQALGFTYADDAIVF